MVWARWLAEGKERHLKNTGLPYSFPLLCPLSHGCRNYSPACSAQAAGEEPIKSRAEFGLRLPQLLDLHSGFLIVAREVDGAFQPVNLTEITERGLGFSDWLEIHQSKYVNMQYTQQPSCPNTLRLTYPWLMIDRSKIYVAPKQQ